MNINGSDDPFYRYKMSVLQVKHETNKTILLNLSQIAGELNRPVKYLVKDLQYILGTQITTSKDKISLNGQVSQIFIQEHIMKFIERFILCQTCGNPETLLYKTKKKLKLQCQGCGQTHQVADNKTTQYILKDLA